MSKGRKVTLVIFILVFLIGLGLALYPYINGFVTSLRQRSEMASFLRLDYSQNETEAGETEPDLLLEAARAYNADLAEHGQYMTSSSVFTEPALNLADYGYDSDVFAVLKIDAIDLEMPIYLGASYDHLTVGACVLGQTSLPIGGESTNCVIAGHRGWKGATMFKYIPNLQLGDIITITNPWETLTYEVVEKQTIYSSDSGAILIRDGEDLVTLFTCDYTSDGVKLRALIICSRVSDTDTNSDANTNTLPG